MRNGSVPEQRSSTSLIALIALIVLAGLSFSAAGESLRDPTRPYSAREAIAAAAPRFDVNAIIVSDERRIAIVNGKRVGVGGQVDSATVVSIEKTELVLDVGGQKVTLGLRDGSTRNED